jgi:hypothetical protein
MRLIVCWGLFRTPRPGHPCRNAHDALTAAGHEPEVIRARGWGLLPAWLNRSDGRREVRRRTGRDSVPVLITDGGETVQGSREIARWAAAHPAPPASVAARNDVSPAA